jgi:hypothetical protein
MGVCTSYKNKNVKSKIQKNNSKNNKKKVSKKNSKQDSTNHTSNNNINNINNNILNNNNQIQIISINSKNKILLNSKEKNSNIIKSNSKIKKISTNNSIINNDDEVDEINNEQLNINYNNLNQNNKNNTNNNKINNNNLEYEKEINILSNSIIYNKNKCDIENKPLINNINKNKIDITIPAGLGEIEYPIYFQTNDEIIIEVNDMSETWGFVNEYGKTNIKGYNNIEYKNNNLGCLFLRIAGTNNLIPINKKKNKIKPIKNRNIFFSANLNINDYNEYEPEGEINLTIKLNENNNNNKNNDNNYIKYIIKSLVSDEDKYNINLELEIIYYINFIRTKPKEFLNNYLYYIEKDEKIFKLLNEFSCLPPLKRNVDLTNLAIETCTKICLDGTTGIEYKKLKNKIKEKGINLKSLGINSLYGIKNSLFIVINMLLDKFNKNNQNKFNILYPDYSIIGVSLKKHMSYRYGCIIIFGDV